MGHYAVVQGNQVINIVVCDSKEMAELTTGYSCIEYNTEAPLFIGDIIDDKKLAELAEAKAEKERIREAALELIASGEAKRLAEIEARRIAEMGKISNLPKVKGKFVSGGND